MARKDKKQAYDYGQVLIVSAVMVSMPRWAGAFIAADVTQMPQTVSEVLHYLNLFSGFGMALLEVLGAAYLLDAWGRMKPKRTHNAKHLDHRWVILTIFVIGLFLLMPLILSPYIVARMNNISVAEIGGSFFDFAWAVAVVMSPVFIIGGAAVARGNSLVGAVSGVEGGHETITKGETEEVKSKSKRRNRNETKANGLSENERLVLDVLRDSPEMSNAEIGRNVGLSGQGVGQIRRRLNGNVQASVL